MEQNSYYCSKREGEINSKRTEKCFQAEERSATLSVYTKNGAVDVQRNEGERSEADEEMVEVSGWVFFNLSLSFCLQIKPFSPIPLLKCCIFPYLVCIGFCMPTKMQGNSSVSHLSVNICPKQFFGLDSFIDTTGVINTFIGGPGSLCFFIYILQRKISICRVVSSFLVSLKNLSFCCL